MIMLRQIQQAILPAAEKTQPILLGWNCSSMRWFVLQHPPMGVCSNSIAMRFQRESPLQAKVGTVPVALTVSVFWEMPNPTQQAQRQAARIPQR
jgi:hypothetical protein